MCDIETNAIKCGAVRDRWNSCTLERAQWKRTMCEMESLVNRAGAVCFGGDVERGQSDASSAEWERGAGGVSRRVKSTVCAAQGDGCAQEAKGERVGIDWTCGGKLVSAIRRWAVGGAVNDHEGLLAQRAFSRLCANRWPACADRLTSLSHFFHCSRR
jgi:hypothetical protein